MAIVFVFVLIIFCVFHQSASRKINQFFAFLEDAHTATQAERFQAHVRQFYSERIADVVAAIEANDQVRATDHLKTLQARFHWKHLADIEGLYQDHFHCELPRVCRRNLYSL